MAQGKTKNKRKELTTKINPRQKAYRIAPGAPCPKCGQGKLEYNGMLNLACSDCGYENCGGFT
jgi:uncharacterized protein (DUF983 family)